MAIPPYICSDCGLIECICPGPDWDQGEALDDWYGEALMAQYDDDPNPYHGDYSEM